MSEALLLQTAEAARKNAYAPYSRFHVGAALRIVSHGCSGETSEWLLADLLPHQFRRNESNEITE